MDRPSCLGDWGSFFAGDSESVAGVIDFFGPATGLAEDKEAILRDWNMDSFDVVVGQFPRIVCHGFGGGRVFGRRRNDQDETVALRFVVVGGCGGDADKSVWDRSFSGGMESFPRS